MVSADCSDVLKAALVYVAPEKDAMLAEMGWREEQLVASDDHALASVALKVWRVTRDGRSTSPNSQRVAGGGSPDWSGTLVMDLTPFGLEAGDAVHVQLVARDESPSGQEGVSRELVLRIPATEEQRVAARSAADSAAARAAAAAKAMQQLQQRTAFNPYFCGLLLIYPLLAPIQI